MVAYPDPEECIKLVEEYGGSPAKVREVLTAASEVLRAYQWSGAMTRLRKAFAALDTGPGIEGKEGESR